MTRFIRAAAVATVTAVGTAPALAEDAGAPRPLDSASKEEILDYARSLERRLTDIERRLAERDEREEESGTLARAIDTLPRAKESALASAAALMTLSGRVEFGYSFNFRHGGAVRGRRGDTLDYNQLRGPDADENGFSFTELELVADRPLDAVGSTGFRAAADYGVVARQADPDPNFDGGGGANAFDMREASISWRAPFTPTDHVDVTVGKYRTPIGFETFGGYGLNWLVTRNPIAVFGTPTTHTGLRLTAPLSETASTSLHVVNGWEEVRDSTDGKNVIWGVTLGKYDWLDSTVNFHVSYGSVEGAPQGDKRSLACATWTGLLATDLEFALDAVVGRQPDRSWHGAAAYLRTRVGAKTTLAGRLGWYADEALGTDGARIVDLTAALAHEIADDLTIALEYRHDFSRSAGTYLDSDGDPSRHQDTLSAAVVFRF
ncbi:MAG: hypothetical protein HMLKMBBP_00026 [Planctomycetes bacterium]|nr:hypothetical protein [Planctomycetota bacterium]